MIARSFKLSGLCLLISTLFSVAQETRFFRIAGPVPVFITTFDADGYLTWTNMATNATFTVQTVTSWLGESSWVDFVQVPVTNITTRHRIIDFDPPQNMAFIPAGLFQMGDTFGEITVNAPTPAHPVLLSAFYMDKFEVTKSLWDDVYQWAETNGYGFDNGGLAKAGDHPVYWISWFDMVKWCNARSESEGFTPCYYEDSSLTTVYRDGQIAVTNACVKWEADGYRLPTEAEWEKAARGGLSNRRFPWGETITHNQANYYSYTNDAFDISLTRGVHPIFATNGMPYTNPGMSRR